MSRGRIKGGALDSPRRGTVVGVCVLLCALTWVVFGQTLDHGFLNYDDDAYVHENPLVREGLSLRGIAAAFRTVHTFTWHPLTTIAHMLDGELFGLDPAGHHLSNVLIHAATAVLLFLVLLRMTGALSCSAFAALVFTVHPQRVESVAWISERKDVLSGLFFVLTLAAYVRYARVRAPGTRFPLGSYLLVLLCFTLGLLSKPMLVTLPFVLLLVDHWPLGRLGEPGAALRHLRPRLVEKLPLFALSVACGLITLSTQQGAMTTTETLGLGARLGNALYAYFVYLRQLFLPLDLAIVYPHAREGLPTWIVALSAVFLLGITWTTFAGKERQPFLLVGWLWFVGMLVPVIGLVQVGVQSHADRYTYLPHIGLYVILAWGAAAAWPTSIDRRWLAALGAVVVAGLTFLAWKQASRWRTSETLWRHTLACTTNNSLAHSQLGVALMEAGRVEEAVAHYRAALTIQPDYATPRYNLGNVLANRGDLDGAIEQYELAVVARPGYAKAYNNLGSALAARGRPDEALAAFERAVEAEPTYLEAHVNLALALEQRGDRPRALNHYQRALELAQARGDEKLTSMMRSRLELLGAPPEEAR